MQGRGEWPGHLHGRGMPHGRGSIPPNRPPERDWEGRMDMGRQVGVQQNPWMRRDERPSMLRRSPPRAGEWAPPRGYGYDGNYPASRQLGWQGAPPLSPAPQHPAPQHPGAVNSQYPGALGHNQETHSVEAHNQSHKAAHERSPLVAPLSHAPVLPPHLHMQQQHQKQFGQQHPQQSTFGQLSPHLQHHNAHQQPIPNIPQSSPSSLPHPPTPARPAVAPSNANTSSLSANPSPAIAPNSAGQKRKAEGGTGAAAATAPLSTPVKEKEEADAAAAHAPQSSKRPRFQFGGGLRSAEKKKTDDAPPSPPCSPIIVGVKVEESATDSAPADPPPPDPPASKAADEPAPVSVSSSSETPKADTAEKPRPRFRWGPPKPSADPAVLASAVASPPPEPAASPVVEPPASSEQPAAEPDPPRTPEPAAEQAVPVRIEKVTAVPAPVRLEALSDDEMEVELPPHAPSPPSVGVSPVKPAPEGARRARHARGAGRPAVVTAIARPVEEAEGGEEEPARKAEPVVVKLPTPDPEPVPTKEEILAKIQVVDEKIAQTDAEIQRLQTESLCGDGRIYGMELQPSQVTPRELKPRPEEVAIYNKNRGRAARVREAVASSLGVACESCYEESPLYTRVQDAPFFDDNVRRHQVVKKYIEAHIRKMKEESKRREVEAAVEYRRKMKSWTESINEAPARKMRPLLIPELLEPQKRRTRSNRNELPAEEDLLEAAQAEEDKIKCLANLPPMLFTDVERVRDTFRSSNGLVVDPVKEELERAFVNTWSEEEKQTFIEKLVDFSFRPEREGVKKNFYAISRFLPNKSTRDCVRFYYLNKRTPFFKQMYKKFEVKNRKAYSLKNKYRHRDDSKREQTSIFADDSEMINNYTQTTYLCTLPEAPGTESKKNDHSDDDGDPQPRKQASRSQNPYLVR